jgi:hypothetical protein
MEKATQHWPGSVRQQTFSSDSARSPKSLYREGGRGSIIRKSARGIGPHLKTDSRKGVGFPFTKVNGSKCRRYTAADGFWCRAGLNQMRNLKLLAGTNLPRYVPNNGSGQRSQQQRSAEQIFATRSKRYLSRYGKCRGTIYRQHLQPHGVFGKQFKDVIRQLNEKGTARVPNRTRIKTYLVGLQSAWGSRFGLKESQRKFSTNMTSRVELSTWL